VPTTPPGSSHQPIDPPTGSLRATLVTAARFWEPRRLIYNLVLAFVVLIWLAATWPHFLAAFVPSSLLPLGVLALLANVCYSAAYLVEVPLRRSALSATRNRLRWALWLLGTVLAVLIENYWIADEIYPSIR
jgi:hypothetical protein